MKTKRQVVEKQIKLQEQLQNAGYNIVTCGNCGTVLIHELGKGKVNCFCGQKMDLSDCPDLYYRGLENNAEFED